jgi:peptide/nickel transport system permease protein
MIEGVETGEGPGGFRYQHAVSRAAGRSRRGLKLMTGSPALALASLIMFVLVSGAVFGPLVWRIDPLAVDLQSALQPPSWDHPMGTDANGRDLLARFNMGAQISLAVATFVVVASAAVGVALGLISGTSRGLVDALIMRVTDALLAFPALILAMAVTVGLGAGVKTAALGITVSVIPRFTLLVRSNVVRIRALPLVEAAVALGASRKRIMFRHILPQATTTIFVESAVVFGYAIVTLASLGFVGLGAKLPTPEWGSMITEGLSYALTGEWWVAFFPGLGVLLVVVAANLFSDQLQAILDPRGPRGRR